MATIRLEIESDGIMCGKCAFMGLHGCVLWPMVKQVLSHGGWVRADECVAAEVAVATIGQIMGGK